MGEKQLVNLLTDEDLMRAWKVSQTWINQRTGPKARRKPFLPTIPNMRPRKFDPDVIAEVYADFVKTRSLKTEKVGKSVVVQKTQMKGVYKPLW